MFNEDRVLLASAARTATQTVGGANNRHRGMVLVVNVTARAVATTLTPSLQLLDPASGEALTIWTAAAAINSGDVTVAYLFYPSPLADAACLYTEAVDMAVPTRWQVTITHGDANSITYSVSVIMIL
jgi:hypothetical protein